MSRLWTACPLSGESVPTEIAVRPVVRRRSLNFGKFDLIAGGHEHREYRIRHPGAGRRASCPRCQKLVGVRKDGTYYAHGTLLMERAREE